MAHKIKDPINQGDVSIVYPGTSKSAFTDPDFYRKCGKTAASGTIQRYGCAICALATYALYKGNLPNTKENVYYAVQQTTVNATNNAADVTYNDFSVKIGSETINVTLESTSDMAAAANSGKICLVKLAEGNLSHFVLLDGMDSTATGFNRYLVADSNGGQLTTLQDAFTKADIRADAKNIKGKYILG